MFESFELAARQMVDPAFRRVLWRSIALTLALLAGLGTLAWWGIGLIPPTGLGWADTVIDILAGLGAVLAIGLLLLPVASMFAGLFLDEVADAVEEVHYPNARGRPQGIVEGALTGIRFLGAMVILNILVLPIYLLAAPLAPILFYLVNGWLVGREFFEQAAIRHQPPEEVRRLRIANRGPILASGALLAFLLTVPVLNLIIPLYATAVMVHVYWRVREGRV